MMVVRRELVLIRRNYSKEPEAMRAGATVALRPPPRLNT